MIASETKVTTENASQYLQQLCKHWSHKFAVEFTPVRGTIPFPENRRCVLDADAQGLAIRIEAPDDASLERMQNVVADHLKRFAFRENFADFEWKKAA